MNYPRKGKFIPFIILQYSGLLSLPDYYEYKWMNILHKHLYSAAIYASVALVSLPLVLESAIFYAIHDTTELLRRLFEAFGCFIFLTVSFVASFKVNIILTLYHDVREKILTKANPKIYEKYEKQANFYQRVTLTLCVSLFVSFIVETWSPMTTRNCEVYKNVYHLKPPYRKLPLTIRTPFLDSYPWPVYIFLYVSEMHLCFLCFASFYFVSGLQTTIALPLTGQYEMLCEFIRLIGREHRDVNGERVFYTDIANGNFLYRTETELFGKHRLQRMTQSNRREKYKIYEKYFVRGIIIRHQKLISCKQRYQDLMSSLFDNLMLVPVFAMVVIAFYQMFFLRDQLFTVEGVKILIEFLIMVVVESQFVEVSEKMDDCHQAIVTTISESNWYLCAPEVRRDLCLVIRRCQRPNHLTFLSGLLVMNHSLIVYWLRFSFSFINFMKVVV
ncbi:hypothetical protein M8J77_025289 [Diaphorina citri]|nr:hypothetical protein M8J77_025289 [Diaphorina citri]